MATHVISVNGISPDPDTGNVEIPTVGYQVYTASLSQGSTAAPTVDVEYENTIGAITYGYSSIGEFTINSDGLFTPYKTVVFINSGGNPSAVHGIIYAAPVEDGDTINIKTWRWHDVDSGVVLAENINDVLSSTFIEIRVYND